VPVPEPATLALLVMGGLARGRQAGKAQQLKKQTVRRAGIGTVFQEIARLCRSTHIRSLMETAE